MKITHRKYDATANSLRPKDRFYGIYLSKADTGVGVMRWTLDLYLGKKIYVWFWGS